MNVDWRVVGGVVSRLIPLEKLKSVMMKTDMVSVVYLGLNRGSAFTNLVTLRKVANRSVPQLLHLSDGINDSALIIEL